MKNYIYIFLCLTLFTTGCLKKTQQPENSSKKSFFSKLRKGTKKKKSSFDENLEAFALDDDTLRNFAQEQNMPNASRSPLPETTHKKASSLFRWEDIESDRNREQFKTLYFKFNKYALAIDQMHNLKADIEYAKKMIKLDKTIVIEGHACHSAGSAIYNMTLSEKRAKFIAQKFIDAGIDKADIKIAPRGQEMPIVHGGNKEAQAANRRVEIFAIDS